MQTYRVTNSHHTTKLDDVLVMKLPHDGCFLEETAPCLVAFVFQHFNSYWHIFVSLPTLNASRFSVKRQCTIGDNFKHMLHI